MPWASHMIEGTGTDERKFLHDVAGPLSTAMLLLYIFLESLQKKADTSSEELLQIRQVSDSLEKIKKLLEERREILIKRGVPRSKA